MNNNKSGYDILSEYYQEFYKGQKFGFAVLVPMELGGKEPLEYIAVFETDEYYHFATYGFSDLGMPSHYKI